MTPVHPDPLDLVMLELRKARRLAEVHVELVQRTAAFQEEATEAAKRSAAAVAEQSAVALRAAESLHQPREIDL